MPDQPLESETLYDILGVSRTASAAEVRAAYRAQIFEVHPDRSDSPEAYERTRLILEAWRVLGDEEERRRYDVTLPPLRRVETGRAARFGGRVGWAVGALAAIAVVGLMGMRQSTAVRTQAPMGQPSRGTEAADEVLDFDLRAIPAAESLAAVETPAPQLAPLPEMPMPRLDPLPEVPTPRLEPLPNLTAVRTDMPGASTSASRRQQWSDRRDRSRQDLERLYGVHAELLTRLGQFRAALDNPTLTFVQAYPVLQRIEQARVAISETERAMASYRRDIESLELLLDDARARESSQALKK